MNKNLNQDFMNEVLSVCIRKKSFFQSINPWLKSEYMPDDDYRQIWEEIEFQYETVNRVTFGVLKLNLRKNRDAIDILKEVKSVSNDIKPDDLVQGLETYIKQQMFIQFIENDITKPFNRGKKDEAFNNFVKSAEIFSKFTLSSEINVDTVFGDYRNRSLQRETEDFEKKITIAYGIPGLDNLMDGGARLGEATMVLGRSGTGKSLFLIHCAIAAVKRGKKVLHIQLEGTRKQVLDRYDAAWTGRLYSEIRKGDPVLDDVKMKNINKVLKNKKGEIFVKAYEQMEMVPIQEIRNYYMELSKEHQIDLIVVDYFELANPDRTNYKAIEERARQDKLGKKFKALAMETNTHVLTATQTNDIPAEKYNNPRFKLTRSDLADHRTKIKPFDNFFTINMTDKEKEERKCRIWLDKIRDGESNKLFYVGTGYAYSKFIDYNWTIELNAIIAAEKEEMENEIEDED